MTARPPRRPEAPTAQVFINKLEAARRQLDAAIRMTFANEDELAIHTVAGAAYRLLRELLHKRGRSDLQELLATGIYETAKSLADGKLSEDQREQMRRDGPSFYEKLLAIAEKIQKSGDDFKPEQVRISGNFASEWNRLSATANFLKHADRDSESLLPLDNVNNDEIIMHACAAYLMASGQTPDNLRQTPEMSAFHIWWLAERDPDHLALEYGDELANTMRRLSLARRRRACLKLLKLFTRWRAEAREHP